MKAATVQQDSFSEDSARMRSNPAISSDKDVMVSKSSLLLSDHRELQPVLLPVLSFSACLAINSRMKLLLTQLKSKQEKQLFSIFLLLTHNRTTALGKIKSA